MFFASFAARNISEVAAAFCRHSKWRLSGGGAMRLKQKSAATVIGSFLAFGAVAFLIFQFFLLKEFKSLEDQQAERNVNRVKEAFGQEINSLIERTRDWAVWDDAYKFVTDHGSEFIESNLTYDAVKSINFNHIIFISKNGSFLTELRQIMTTRRLETYLMMYLARLFHHGFLPLCWIVPRPVAGSFVLGRKLIW